MTKHANIPEPDDEVSLWIRQHPEVWADAVDAPSSSEIDDLVGQVISGARDRRRAEESGRRRRRFVATGALTIVVVTGGAVGVAALIRSGQPSRPSEGIACRSAADTRADAIVVEAGSDPVGRCRTLWTDGELTEPGQGDWREPFTCRVRGRIWSHRGLSGRLVSVRPTRLDRGGRSADPGEPSDARPPGAHRR